MKIAWIAPGFSSDESDWCIPALLDLARVMAAHHDLHVFALRYPYRRDRYRVHGATVHAIGGGHRGRWTLPGVWRAMLREVTREHTAAPFDVLHAFWLYEPGVIAALLKRNMRTRTIVSLCGGELSALPSIGYGLWRWPVQRRAMRWAAQHADVVTAGSTGLLERARSLLSPSGFAFAPLGVDVARFSPTDKHASASPVIVNVGSLQPVKAQADVIRAFRFVVDRVRDARLEIVGEGDLKPALGALAAGLGLSDRIAFRGEVRHEQLPEAYRGATLFVQASVYEAQGMAALEAAACGLPLAGTAIGAIADLSPDAAIATPPGDPIRLAQAILSVLEDSTRRRALSEAARARVTAEYTVEKAANRFETLYR
jgi:glycosyltransferase involved in cell wall biosynthesis